jgi:sulfite reductase (NADPH) flavoprotein alpha-component
MTISIWRYSHLTLAISSALFIAIAAFTGIILAFEPISNKLNPYSTPNITQISIAETIEALEKKYDETIHIEIDNNNFVSASIINDKGGNEIFYINPKTGEKVGSLIKKTPFLEFITNLHRSLFLKSTGRFIIGLVSFLLFLIAFTGVLLIVKRQGGVYKIFSKIVKEESNQYYHVFFGRLFLIPIIIITATGVYLCLERFSFLPKTSHTTPKLESKKIIAYTAFDFFKKTKLGNIKKIEFPFSSNKEDYYTIKTINNEFKVDQFNGQVIDNKKQSWGLIAAEYSFLLHTGNGSILWSSILLLSCFAIFYFICSGFYMTLKRKKGSISINNDTLKDAAEFVILVGSETGSTLRFATAFKEGLIKANKLVFMAELNEYTSYDNAKNIILFTATYGDGTAPTNAQNFTALVNTIEPKGNLNYSVVGFGSKQYPAFCKFAILVHASLQIHSQFIPQMPLFKIDNQHLNSFKNWKNEWSRINNIHLEIALSKILDQQQETTFKIINTNKVNIDNTFQISLKPTSKTIVSSGDLLAIKLQGEQRKRLYSIAKIDNVLVLSIKKHEFGTCSNYLYKLNKKDRILGEIQQNKKFHFPEKVKDVILIANGTGIAPFLGMIQENKKVKIHLFWGGKTKKSLVIYDKYITTALKNKTLNSFTAAYSQEQKKYVQDLLKSKTAFIANILKTDGVVLICGSFNMQYSVEQVLGDIASQELNINIEELRNKNQIRTDCY